MSNFEKNINPEMKNINENLVNIEQTSNYIIKIKEKFSNFDENSQFVGILKEDLNIV